VATPRVELAEGRTSVRALNTPTVETGTPDPSSERITPAYASPENLPPEYPAYALKAGCRNGVVAVRVYLGADGNVTAQRDVPERPLPSDSCHVAFRAAVQGAVKDWRFAPAFRLTPVPGRDPGDGRPPLVRWEQSPIAVYLDFEFSFEIVQGKGVVRGR
jgi:outer membrane biosynthesis protein TonB